MDKNISIITWHKPKDKLPEKMGYPEHISKYVLIRSDKGEACLGYYNFEKKQLCMMLGEHLSIKFIEWAELPHL
ncbi:MAG: hypothetical protein ACFFD2_12170 [Promethearchaeota archaeon]